MSKEHYDMFLVLTRTDGATVDGESTDMAMAKDAKTGKSQKPIEIDQFDLNLEKASFESEDKTKRAVENDDPFEGVESTTKATLTEALGSLRKERDTLLAIIQQNKADVGGKLVREHAFTIRKGIDLSSVELYRAYCEATLAPSKNSGSGSSNGDTDTPVKKPSVFSQAVVSIRKAGGTSDNIYLKFVFEDLNIVHYSVTVNGTEHDEKVDFTFDKVTMTYRPQASTGLLTTNVPQALVAEIDFREDSQTTQ